MNNDQRIATLVLHGWEPCGRGDSEHPWVGVMKVGFGTLWMYRGDIADEKLAVRKSALVYTQPYTSDAVRWSDIPATAISRFFNSEEL